jgi:hypothetical protein
MEASIFEKWISDQEPKRSFPNIPLCSPTSICKNNPHWKLNGFSIGSCLQSAFLTVISKVPYEFFSVPPLSVLKEKDSVFYRVEKKKKKKERDRERKEAILEINSISRSDFLVPFLYNLTTTERTGCLSIWS